MQSEERPANDNEDEIERAIEDKRDDVLAADATGMVAGREATLIVELEPGAEVPPV